ncbi:hypothetical protein B0H14DRAFT_2586451 [Mycena olivaceomarginata]|nr:hypothetical protein B0H14DRAFT_2586451 [Mycena olivaceomarginata]
MLKRNRWGGESPCHWHPSLTNAQQLWEDRCWKSIGTWKVGIQKLSKKGMRTEIVLRTATRKALRLAGKAFADSDVALEVRHKKSVKTSAARAKAIKAAGAAAKKKKKTIAVQKPRVPLPSADIVFKSERLNILDGDTQGRARIAHSAEALMGIKKRAPRKKKDV